MDIPPADINWFAETFSENFQMFHEAWITAGSPELTDEPSPEQLADAMDQLISLLYRFDENSQQLQPVAEETAIPDLSELGNYGFSILENLMQLTAELGMEGDNYAWESLAIGLALWIARQGGDLSLITLTVNGLATIANDAMEPRDLEKLYHTMGEILNAVSPTVSEEGQNEDLQHPWRLLLLNRAIVATRTLSPRLMVEAFNSIAEYLPDEAPEFFHEGMGQVEIQNYPKQVQDVIRRFCDDWPTNRILH
ncbi:MAG: hypothetical protein ABW168_11500 [Sedimenticola sp.]